MKRLSAVLAIVILLSSFTYTFAEAYAVPAYVKVGLFFDSAAKSEFDASVSDKLVIGHVYDYGFYPHMQLDTAAIHVEKGGGVYLRSAQTYPNMAEAAYKAKEMRAMGICAFGAYCDGAYYVAVGQYANAGEAQNSIGDVAAAGLEFAVYTASTKAVCVNAGGYDFLFHSDSETFAFSPSDPSGYINFNKRKYRGYFSASRLHSGNISIINLISMDDYLGSVVGSEMYASWHIEALKAQAVIARTYACTVTGYKKYGIDLTDDTRTQAYNGISNETESTVRAARETSGRIILYKGQPAQTFFGSSSGGKTADVYSAWGGGQGLDYLVSVDDPYEDTENIPNGVWTVVRSADEIEATLAKSGIYIGDVTAVTVIDRGRDERVRKLTITGTTGAHTVTFEKCRTLFGLNSQYYYVSSNADAGQGPDENTVSVTLWGTYEVQVPKDGSSAPKIYGAGDAPSKTPEWAISSDGIFTFNGRGYGHGIGMSQYGAKGMAEHGFGYADIIAHYYPGTELSY